MTLQTRVAAHYASERLAERILESARLLVGDRPFTAVDLSPVDEFHIGGREASERFLAGLGLDQGMAVLDVGCGIGGTSRLVAERHGCRVTGIDLTEEFCRVGRLLTAALGLTDRVAIRQASALDLPFADGSFDAAYTIHMAMNIADKERLYREVHRVLRPGAVFGIYDILAGPERGPLDFPVPWAATADTSFLAAPDELQAALTAAGFTVERTIDRTEVARTFFDRLHGAGSSAPPLGLHLLMGEDFPVKVANMVGNVEAGRCGPWEIVCRRP